MLKYLLKKLNQKLIMASSNYTDPQAEQLQTQSNQIDPSYVSHVEIRL